MNFFKHLIVGLIIVMFSVSCTLVDSGPETDTDTDINHAPTVNPVAVITSGGTVSFNAGAHDIDGDNLVYIWSFNDGNTSSLAAPSHTYTQTQSVQNFNVTLTVYDPSGEIATQNVPVIIPALTSSTTVTSATPSVSVSIQGVASFTANATNSGGEFLNYSWSFGDNVGTSAVANPTYSYPVLDTDRTYNATLTVYSNSSNIAQETISVFVAAGIDSGSLTIAAPSVMVSSEGVATFTANATNSDGDLLNYSWDFGVGTNTSSLENPVYTYPVQAIDMNYTATLSVYSDNSNLVQESISVFVPAGLVVHPNLISVDAGNDFTVETGETFTLNAVVNASDESTITYSWSFDNRTVDTQSVTTSIDSAGIYDVTVVATDNSGSGDVESDTLTITVNLANTPINLTSADAGSDIRVDENESFTLTASSDASDASEDSGLVYSWLIDGNTFTGKSISTSLSTAGNYSAQLTVTVGEISVTDSLQITVDPIASTGGESYGLITSYDQYDLYRINNCGWFTVVNNDEYLFVDGISEKINNSWSHVDNSAQWNGVKKQPSEYAINTGYTSDSECNNARSINNILMKKFGDWDASHANGFKFPMANDNPTFEDLDTITMDIYVDSVNSELPTIQEISSAYPALTAAQLTEFDDGEFYLDMRITYDGTDPLPGDDYSTQGDIHGAINLSIDQSYMDQWVRVEIPVRSLNFTEEVANWATAGRDFSEIKHLIPSTFAFVAETKSRKVYRHYDENFDVNTASKLFKEEAIRIKYLEISKNDGTLTDPVVPVDDIDYSQNSDMLYTSGELYSLDAYLYGSIEVRMKVAAGSGIVNGYFTYKNGSEISGTPWEEIDMEVLGKNNAVDLQTNVITGTSAARITSEAHHTQVQSLADDFHVYRMDWYPDRVEFFLDGQFLSRAGHENMSVDQYASLINEQSLRLNLWPANIAEWVGVIDDSVYPVSMEVDYMEYSSLNNAQDGFNLEWRDEFNSIDTTKWGFGDWTFGENDARFNPEQVTTVDGILTITLDHYR